MDRPLFAKWLVLQAAVVLGFAGMGYAFYTDVHGPSFVAIPAILALYAWGSATGARVIWGAPRKQPTRVIHEAKALNFWGWICQTTGILCTIAGFWRILATNQDINSLGDAIREGGGVALVGSFVGVVASQLLAAQERMIDHEYGNEDDW